MKEIKEQIKLRYLLVWLVSIFIFLYAAYRFLKPLIVDTASLSVVFFIVGMSLFFMSLFVFYILKKQNDELLEDIEELHEHILDISDKEYSSNINIKHYSELLQISLLFKNILKRLNK